jgi:hypothetical protein
MVEGRQCGLPRSSRLAGLAGTCRGAGARDLRPLLRPALSGNGLTSALVQDCQGPIQVLCMGECRS